MPQTIESPTYRQFVTQFQNPDGTLNAALSPVLRKDVSTDGKGFKPNQRYATHTPDGHDAPVGTALTFEDGTYGGNYMPRYSELLQDIPNICGTDGFVSSETLPDGRKKTVYQLGHKPRQLREQTAWFGYGNKCWLLKKGAIKTWSIESERSGDTGGNKEYHFNEVTPNQPMVSQVAQNHKTRITAANVSSALGLSVTAPGGVAKAVSLAIGDTPAQIIAKFTAQGLTAAATGGVATGTGKTQIITGSGNALNIGGVAVDLTTPETVAALVTRIKTANPTRTTLTGTGTITKAVAGVITAYTLSGAGTPAANGAYTQTAANANPTAGVALYTKSGGVAYIFNNSGVYTWRHGPDLTNAEYYTSQNYASLAAAVAAGPIANFAVGFNGSAPNPTGSATATSGGTPATVSITLTDNATAGNAADLPVVGTGYSFVATAPGGSGGVIDLEFTNPGNALVTVNKTSGDAGYVISILQAGNDGTGPAELPGAYIEPNHWVVYKADTWAALQAINMGDRTTPAPIDGDTIVRTARRHSINLDNLVEAVETETRTLGAYGHVATRPEVKANITLLVLQNADGFDYCEDLFATDNRGGCGTKPFWLRFAARCGDREFWIDLFCARDETATDDSQDGQAQWQFPLTRIYRSAGSLFFTVIEPSA